MSNYIKVENEKNLVRDVRTNAILETDKDKLRRHRAIAASMQEKDRIVDMLSKEVEDMKIVMKTILEKLDGNNSH